MYVAPRPDVLIVLCSKQEPSDTENVGTGKLIVHNACKADGARVLILAQTITNEKHSKSFRRLKISQSQG
jgi:hypothetical protein